MPGMRCLARLHCQACARDFYGDLPVGQGMITPLLIDDSTSQVYDDEDAKWFGQWLQQSHRRRTAAPVAFTTEEFRPLRQVVLLNCLDTLYGHSLLKLLNVQYYLDHCPDLDVVVLIQPFLRWMVPEGVAAIWTVDVPLRRGTEWNDWLANELLQRVRQCEIAWLSVAFAHPHPQEYRIQRFTGVAPFPIDEWQRRLTRPAVTFSWRTDRLWYSGTALKWLDRAARRVGGVFAQLSLAVQQQRINALYRHLKRALPTLDFAVVGLGVAGGLDPGIADQRTLRLDPTIERAWCERYAQSHVVIGIHGSNLLLPSAHAGAVVELMPSDRWGNALQDLLFQPQDMREALFRYRLVPTSVSPKPLSRIVRSLLHDHWPMLIRMRPAFCRHLELAAPER